MLKQLLIVATVAISTTLPIAGSNAAYSPLSTVSNNDEIRIGHVTSVEYQINSSNGTTGDLLLNGNPNQSSQDGYEVEVTAKSAKSYTLTFTPTRPIFNAQYPLLVSQSPNGADALELQVSINLDPEYENLFHVDGFTFECSSTGDYLCVVSPQISDVKYPKELEMWVPYEIERKSRAKGSTKWSSVSYEGFPLTDEARWGYSRDISVPTEVSVKVKYREKIFNFISIALPIPRVSLSTAGSAIVGQNFSVSISGPKNYSATCSINGFQLAVKNGVGKISLYGKRPGNLRLFAVCKANANWATASQGRDIYIRS